MLEYFAPKFVFSSSSYRTTCSDVLQYLEVYSALILLSACVSICRRRRLDSRNRREGGGAGCHRPAAYPIPPSSNLGTDITTTLWLHQRTGSGSRIMAGKWIKSLWQAVGFAVCVKYKINLKMWGDYIVPTTEHCEVKRTIPKRPRNSDIPYFKVFKNKF